MPWYSVVGGCEYIDRQRMQSSVLFGMVDQFERVMWQGFGMVVRLRWNPKSVHNVPPRQSLESLALAAPCATHTDVFTSDPDLLLSGVTVRSSSSRERLLSTIVLSLTARSDCVCVEEHLTNM